MTSNNQRAELHRKIWAIANRTRGAVSGQDFRNYILGILFYRFVSEDIAKYFNENEWNAGEEDFDFAKLTDEEVSDEIAREAVKVKGYFLYPSQLFENVISRLDDISEDLNVELKNIFDAFENSANGAPSEDDIKGLFAEVNLTASTLGGNVNEKNKNLADVLRGIAEIDFGTDDFRENNIDVFGDAYEYLIGNYAANAGKSGGEFFTPQNVSRLVSLLATDGMTEINKIYDPTAGSGSLLLQSKKLLDSKILKNGFFGQEKMLETYNLARMNMILHGVNFADFNIKLGDTLLNPKHNNEKPFDAIVSNPPYSIGWIGSDDPTLINDDRFAPAGVLAPKSKADFAFILHALNYLSAKGRAAIVSFPGIFYRSGAEQKIRKYLIDNNFVEAIIQLPPNLFFGTSIATCVLVLAKNKVDTNTLFIDASAEFKKETNNNILTEENIAKIIGTFREKSDQEYFAKSVSYDKIRENDYNLSVSSYVEAEDKSEKIDIDELNVEIRETVAKITKLREEIDVITEELGK